MDLGKLTIATRERKSVQSSVEDDLGKLTIATRERWSQEAAAAGAVGSIIGSSILASGPDAGIIGSNVIVPRIGAA